MSWIIRQERPGDIQAIHALVTRAFEGHPYADGNEQHVTDRLRADGDLVLSLVAMEAGKSATPVIGQATYSRAIPANGDDGWMVLGPVSVDPAQQGKGIGRALIEAGDAAMKEAGAKGITVLGDPAFYARFGYIQKTAMTLEGEFAGLNEFLQVRTFGATIPRTALSYADAFG